MLAILNSTHYAGMPAVPAIKEIYPNLTKPDGWWARRGCRRAAIHSPDVRAKIEADGMVLIGNSPQEVASMYQASFAIFSRIIKEAGIKPE